ncbi:hypothetical protein F8M41_016310 [Gigaspora margarita]|uniref:Uncharacterized protein n=1 Tax=Gigaspora margarita TaxID=4874 RepID=A0A8H4APG2_GIGMA|nr:hypothetical protein F8M41_016310 [Gigaspora margarita]
MVQNPVKNAKMEAPIPQIISELTKTMEIWDRDELSIIGFENPRESDSLETRYEKPLALLILLYNINTDSFILVSYKRYHKKKNSNSNKLENIHKALYGSI